jgi:hypothetical protein
VDPAVAQAAALDRVGDRVAVRVAVQEEDRVSLVRAKAVVLVRVVEEQV